MIAQLAAMAFVLAAMLNITNLRRFVAASMFAVVHSINTVVTFQDEFWYYYAGAASISLLVFTFLVSNALWSRLLASILLCSICVSLLGLVNFNAYHIAGVGKMVDATVIITTILELAVIVAMSTGKLDSYATDNYGQLRQHTIRRIFGIRYNFFTTETAR